MYLLGIQNLRDRLKFNLVACSENSLTNAFPFAEVSALPRKVAEGE